MGQKKSNFDHLNLGNSIFTGFNDKEGLMICGCEQGFSKKDQRDWENGTYEKAQNVIHTFTPIKPLYSAKEQTHGLMIITSKNGLNCGEFRLTAQDWAVHLRNP